MKNIAVILSGCGFKDGAEITETVSSLICLSQLNTNYKCFAPETSFLSSNHISDENEEERNVLIEASRISRGDIEPLNNLKPENFDAIVFPGGFGVAKNLCDWASRGSQCSVLPELQQIIIGFHQQSKPIGAWCIAPALIAKVLGHEGITVTIGQDQETAEEICKTGAEHENCAVDDFITDRAHKIITTPAYMYDAKPHEVFSGISRATKELVEMA